MQQVPRYPQLHVDVAPEDADEASALLFELGAEGVEERDQATLAQGAAAGKTTLVASFATEAEAHSAAHEVDASWSPRVTELVGDAWRDEWKKHFVPFRLTDRVTIRPPWQPYTPEDASERVLELEPGRAFGTGLHPTTALVARALESLANDLFAKNPKATVLDVGTGSGILALVALVLGAERARATDIDPDAVSLAIENAERNGLSSRLSADTTAIEQVSDLYDVVVANIEASVLIAMAAPLAARVKPGGVLVLSGILRERADEVRRAFEALARFARTESTEQGEWSALVFRG